ncbi:MULTISPECIES: ABC transporter ATP-binding protein [unclassified Blautia]|uniref:ABC transporter ATP-binding protein n=1 Tax=unclassified Blautia TaxID=2648079 RepID=UPI00260A68A1|nr:ABC transporter ATP-binding protein [uncultured Blautia sp.]MBS5324150.1 ABC transporter ATP-binding protein [Lachnospiraceae bacterium]
METLTAQNLEYTYQGKYQKVTALSDVTCHFEKGKFYALIGRSGSGKTTLLSLLAGLGTPTKGEILADGVPLKKKDLERHRRENVSMIYQSFHLFPCLTILENVMYPMQIIHEKKKTARCRAAELLKSVGIKEEYYKKLPAMLSGGEQQRTAIARALASDAKFLLADEPTGNLDVENSQKIMDIFRKLVEEDYCVVVVTHDREIARQADVVYEIVDGRLCFKEIKNV